MLSLKFHAQISTSRVVYHAKHSFPEAKVFNGKNTLHFNGELSLFIHNNYPSENDLKKEGYTINIKVGDKEGFPIFISFKDSISYSKTKGSFGGFSLCILKEKLDTISWEIKPEQKKIKNYNCIKATTTYEGRTYEVWFTPDIPAPFGPYRLRGLPGLILEAKSIDNKVAWEFVGFEAATNEPIKLTPPSNGQLLTWEKFVKNIINYKIKKESDSNDQYTVSINDPNPDFFIEKGKFSIYKKYLKN